MTVKASPSDHVLVTDSLSDDEAKSQLDTIAYYVGEPGQISLPWVTPFGSNVLAAQLIKVRA